MVVCKCRKATKLYCFVHKVPVCGECICFPEHQICVIRTYSEWVIDGEYDWPPNCCLCKAVLEEGTDSQTTRLGCLHVIHSSCLVSHIKSFPSHTAPAGYVCPVCSTSIWPPKNVKDSGSRLHTKLKEVIMQTGLEKNLFGNHPVSLPVPESRNPPPAFASDPLIGAGATTRKGAFHVERQNSEISYYADDEEGNRKKYTKRGSLRHKFLRSLIPFWSSALPTLPVTVPPRKDASTSNDVPEGRLRPQRSSRMDPRKILLLIAIMACMATMGILYYRLVQRGLGEEMGEDEQQ
ncbi:Zinc finger protein-like 1-like protein [Morus notabilis]|uniref:Zinc finger protein-like 1-like protein n=1 Tax=Morus notabilis TaxID=981085 RepID=W9RAN5_9ROSA|nr:Zinc finger protein-like 1-like protein [Morus notabilis]